MDKRWQQLGELLVNYSTYLAGYAAGLFHDSQPLKQQWVKLARVIEPNPHTAPVYAELYEIYHHLYRQTREDMHRLAERFG